MKKIRYILLFALIVAGLSSKAQQDPLYTQYMNQLLSINPAYAGSKGVTSATLLVREMYFGFINQSGEHDNPRTQTLFVHAPLNSQMGVGGSIVNDKIYIYSNTGVFGDYSYSINYPGDKFLSLGLKAGFSYIQIDLTDIDLKNTDPNDRAFQQDIEHKFLPNAGVGVYYSSPDYYFGLAIPKLISNKIRAQNVETGTVSKEELHAFFMGGYVFDFSRILKFKPYFMVRFTPNAPISADLTAQAVFYERLWVGATYRFGNSFGFMGQVQATKQLKIGYAYDLTTTEIGVYSKGTHEILVNFDFSFGRGRVRSPRYF